MGRPSPPAAVQRPRYLPPSLTASQEPVSIRTFRCDQRHRGATAAARTCLSQQASAFFDVPSAITDQSRPNEHRVPITSTR